MLATAAGPDAFSWLAAVLCGLHSLRWLLSSAALAATVLTVAGAQWRFTGQTHPGDPVRPLDGDLPIGVFVHVLIFLFAAATWFATVWLFARFGGENAKWIAWGMGEKFLPPADRLHFIASAIALIWGAAWLPIPIGRHCGGRSDPIWPTTKPKMKLSSPRSLEGRVDKTRQTATPC